MTKGGGIYQAHDAINRQFSSFNNFSNNLVFSKQRIFLLLISNHTFFYKKDRILFETPH